jgi:hypothetical protein
MMITAGEAAVTSVDTTLAVAAYYLDIRPTVFANPITSSHAKPGGCVIRRATRN